MFSKLIDCFQNWIVAALPILYSSEPSLPILYSSEHKHLFSKIIHVNKSNSQKLHYLNPILLNKIRKQKRQVYNKFKDLKKN